jgi:patatin-like phospholipase/acyl hydrolase
MLVMVEVLEEMCIESSYGGDFVSRFDLVAGVSAGGVGSIVISQTKTT